MRQLKTMVSIVNKIESSISDDWTLRWKIIGAVANSIRQKEGGTWLMLYKAIADEIREKVNDLV